MNVYAAIFQLNRLYKLFLKTINFTEKVELYSPHLQVPE